MSSNLTGATNLEGVIMKLNEAMEESIELNGEIFILSGKNRYNDDCFYPKNGRKDYFARTMRPDEKFGPDQPHEKFFEIDGKRYKLIRAMH